MVNCVNLESHYDEFCRLDEQCQRVDRNSRCNLDLNVCRCLPRFLAQAYGNQHSKRRWCVGKDTHAH